MRQHPEDRVRNWWPIEKFEHDTMGVDGKECPCEPVVEYGEEGLVIIHKRMDRAYPVGTFSEN